MCKFSGMTESPMGKGINNPVKSSKKANKAKGNNLKNPCK